MDTEKTNSSIDLPTEQKQKPALCISAHSFDIGSVVHVLLRAERNGYFVFITVPESGDHLATSIAEKFDAITIETMTDHQQERTSVERIARALGFPGVLYVPHSDVRVDFSRCEDVHTATDEFGAVAPLTSNCDLVTIDTMAAIPAYNEEDTIADVVSGVQPKVDLVVVINDGSTDNTTSMAERAGAMVIEHGENRGYGAALKTAFVEADKLHAESLVVLDGDGQHKSEDVPKLLQKRRETDANIVIGSRFHGGTMESVPRYRQFGLMIINVLTNLGIGTTTSSTWVSDTQSGFRVYDREAIQNLASGGSIDDGMSASTDILYHAQMRDYDIAEVATTIKYENGGTSTLNPVLHGVELVSNILKVMERERPLTFFGIPGFVSVIVGIGFGYWAVTDYLHTGTLPDGVALFCIFFTFLGALLSFTSVILHSLKLQLDTLVQQQK